MKVTLTGRVRILIAAVIAIVVAASFTLLTWHIDQVTLKNTPSP